MHQMFELFLCRQEISMHRLILLTLCSTLGRLYERAIAAAGTDFRSDKLWDSYMAWEKSKGHLKALTALYDRLIKIPTQLYSHHFDK